MSNTINTNDKINANVGTADALANANITPTSVHAEPARPDWDRTITPAQGATDDVKFDFERPNMAGSKVDGVRYAKLDDRGRVMQVRVVDGIERHYWTLKDAVDAGILSEDFAIWTGHMAEYDAKIARVEIMEKLGLPIADGIAMAYAQGVADKRAAEKKRNEREEEIVNGGKDAYVKTSANKAGDRFDKIQARVNARAGK